LDRRDPVIGSIGSDVGINASIVPILPIPSDLDPSDPTDISDPITRPKTNPIRPILDPSDQSDPWPNGKTEQPKRETATTRFGRPSGIS
jgi:hypothetical protein